jgi:RHS repeat-associated protein
VSIHSPIRTEGYTGHYWDKEASLYYAKARYYDPFTARFTQADSFLGAIDNPPSLHRYLYAADNPTFFVDPSGHAGSDAQARHFGNYRGDPLKPMDVSNAAALSLGSIEATAETGVELGVGTLFGIGHFARSVFRGEMSRFLVDTYDSAHEFVSTFGARAERAAAASAQASARGDYYEAGRVVTRELIAPTALAAVTIVETGRIGVGAAERLGPAAKRLGGAIDDAMRAQAEAAQLNQARAIMAGRRGEVGSTFPMTDAQAAAVIRRARVNKAGVDYPVVKDVITGKEIEFPEGPLARVPRADRAVWNLKERGRFIAEWHRRGNKTPSGGWEYYDIHHVKPLEFGGTNAFENLAPVERTVEHQRFNRFWEKY